MTNNINIQTVTKRFSKIATFSKYSKKQTKNKIKNKLTISGQMPCNQKKNFNSQPNHGQNNLEKQQNNSRGPRMAYLLGLQSIHKRYENKLDTVKSAYLHGTEISAGNWEVWVTDSSQNRLYILEK